LGNDPKQDKFKWKQQEEASFLKKRSKKLLFKMESEYSVVRLAHPNS